MNRKIMVTQLNREISSHLHSLGKWQALGLAVMVFGLLTQGQAQVSKIAEGAAEEGSYNTVRQRLKRWLANSRTDWRGVQYEWVKWVWGRFGGGRAVLVVDETKLSD